MNETQALAEWDRLVDVAPAEEASVEAKKKAALLIGRVLLIAKERDNEELIEPTLVNLIAKHKEFWLRVLAKRYQTLIDEGKI